MFSWDLLPPYHQYRLPTLKNFSCIYHQELHRPCCGQFSDNAHKHMNELQLVKSQLEHKTQLLVKVKVLLQRAAAKEKMLHNKVRLHCQALAPFRKIQYPN
jgi:hypothetical protein